MAEKTKQVATPKSGIMGRVGRALARTGVRLGFDNNQIIPGSTSDVASRGYRRDAVHSYTYAPIASRAIWELYRIRNESRQNYLTTPVLQAFVRFCDVQVIGAEDARLEFPGIPAEDQKRLKPVLDYLRRQWGIYQQTEVGSAGEGLRDLARRILRDALVDGDCFVIPYQEKGTWKYQPFPGDALAEQYHAPKPNGHQRVLGVEINERGRVLAYHFGFNAKYRQLSNLSYTAEGAAVRVPAEQVMHLRPTSGGTQDLRGLPWCSGCIDDISRVEQFYESFTRAAVRRASVGIALTSNPDLNLLDDTSIGDRSAAEIARGATVGEISTGDPSSVDPRNLLPYQEARSKAGDNLIIDPGYTTAKIDTGAPSPQEAMILKTLELRICSALRVSPMSLLGDYMGVSFSAGQLAMIQERNTISVLQKFLTRQLHTPIYRKWLTEIWPEVLKRFPNELETDDIEIVRRPTIRLKMYEVLEKHKQAQGYLIMFQNGLITAAEFRDSLGLPTGDMEGILEQAIADRERLGVMPSAEPAPDSEVEDPDDEDKMLKEDPTDKREKSNEAS